MSSVEESACDPVTNGSGPRMDLCSALSSCACSKASESSRIYLWRGRVHSSEVFGGLRKQSVR